jgi:hypothetical protein
VIWITSFGIATVAHVAFALLLLRGWQGRQAGLPLLAATIGRAAWGAVGLLVVLVPLAATLVLLEAANGLRVALWLWLALTVLAISRGDVERPAGFRRSPLQLICILAAAGKLVVGLAWLAFPQHGLVQQANHLEISGNFHFDAAFG